MNGYFFQMPDRKRTPPGKSAAGIIPPSFCTTSHEIHWETAYRRFFKKKPALSRVVDGVFHFG